MNNYYYILTGLPFITSSFDSKDFDYSSISTEIKSMLSAKDIRLVEWLEFSFSEDNLGSHYYRQAGLSTNLFIKNYIPFDNQLRNIMVSLLAKTHNKKADDYMVGELDIELDEYKAITNAYATKNIIDREKQIDRIRWEKISEIVNFEYFTINNILAFLAKAKLIDRWSKMDNEQGAILFKQFVDEVRGTFKGINKEEI